MVGGSSGINAMVMPSSYLNFIFSLSPSTRFGNADRVMTTTLGQVSSEMTNRGRSTAFFPTSKGLKAGRSPPFCFLMKSLPRSSKTFTERMAQFR